MDVFIEKCAGLDVHSKSIVACILKGKAGEEPYAETQTFGTMTKDLYKMLKWLKEHGITHNFSQQIGLYESFPVIIFALELRYFLRVSRILGNSIL